MAILDDRSWAAKHYWREAGVTTYEFDEPLPAGPVVLHIPFKTA